MTHNIQGVEIFSVGKWNGDEYTEAHLAEMVESFNKTNSTLKPPLKLGHSDKQGLLQKDGYPAAGWVTNLYVQGSKLLADFSDIPDKIYNLIKTKAYRKVSSEIFWNIDYNGTKYGRMLAGVALLGAELPAVNNLSDMLALYGLDGELKNVYTALENDAIVKRYFMPQDEEDTTHGGSTMSENIQNEKITELSTKVESFSKTIENLTTENESLRTFKVDAEKRIQDSERERVLDAFETEKISSPSMREYIKVLLEEDRKEYTIEKKTLTKSEVIKALLALGKENAKVNFTEASKDYKKEEDDGEDALGKKIEKYMGDNKCSYKAAYKAIMGEQNKGAK